MSIKKRSEFMEIKISKQIQDSLICKFQTNLIVSIRIKKYLPINRNKFIKSIHNKINNKLIKTFQYKKINKKDFIRQSECSEQYERNFQLIHGPLKNLVNFQLGNSYRKS